MMCAHIHTHTHIIHTHNQSNETVEEQDPRVIVRCVFLIPTENNTINPPKQFVDPFAAVILLFFPTGHWAASISSSTSVFYSTELFQSEKDIKSHEEAI